MQEQATGKTLLIRNARVLVTMNEGREEIADGALYIRGKVIEQVGKTEDLPQEADEIIDASNHVVIPGLINTHHHMYQSLTRAIPSAQNGELFNWLTNLYPIWAGLTPEMIRVSTLTAMAELILSGCTTSSDHLYIYPNQTRLDDSLEAAAQIGMRFHGARGAMSVGQSKGGLPPDRVVEEEPAILKDTQRLIETYHDSQRHAMQRIVVAPCSPFSVSRDLMREAADLARHYGVSLHTHLAENVNDIAYSREKFNMTPAEYAEDCGWVGHDVWHAHCVQLDEHGIELFARTGTGVAHCPCSNMRLASGIAPIRKMLDAGVPVGLGVDGSASNDSAHMLGEVRQAMLLQRVGFGPDAMTARQALEVATLGGAKVLNRDDIGALKPGMSADVVMFDTRQIAFAGALHDPVAALVFCTPANVNTSIINGRVIVREGQLTTIDLGAVLERHNHLAYQLAEAAR
ncbi:cytosine/adenosine deaminase-related metal-dependent hydrolase [Herbaspirillum sp. 1173]|uniref:8-oxoguanine deaminase n=1 Tax=unclassified Herbaspirillum TaxID=2624150 RepID=UPI001AE6908B|nr:MULTISPECIES: 8-oxoguanine deaminase [unclassified Herbaspirillum]MBP1314506.1 cytosine/adenosine deaminase-related metal-dependent hydrolase [Herbaspirillum sp. 1130]MDR6739655.1 cytosine/adenosine deaminase-related metal-dependent hydrolase [Herbaspirillum sp. 1173]